MAKLSRKQREIQQREELILRIARRLLIKDGYFGLSMDRIAEATEYAKGTIYQHFRSKEDVLTGIMVANLEREVALLARAASYGGKPRERMVVAMIAEELHHRLGPDHIRAAEIINIRSFSDKADPRRRMALATWHQRRLSILQGLIRDGLAAGDLTLSRGMTEAAVLLSIIGMTYGTRTLLHNDLDGLLAIADSQATLRGLIDSALDGCGWRPLSTEWDYAATIEMASEALFASEMKRATVS